MRWEQTLQMDLFGLRVIGCFPPFTHSQLHPSLRAANLRNEDYRNVVTVRGGGSIPSAHCYFPECHAGFP